MPHAYSYLLTSAKNGHPEALWRTGVMLYQPEYARDFGIQSEPEKAREYILKSAELGSLDAYEQLARGAARARRLMGACFQRETEPLSAGFRLWAATPGL